MLRLATLRIAPVAGRERTAPGAALAAGLALGLVTLVGLHLARGLSYWDYSEGVYAYLSRQLLDGANLYGHVVVAQPPWTILAGAVGLAVHDGLAWLRWFVGALQLVGGAFAALTVWRLTHSRVATAVACPLTLLTPWAVHEHGSLTPELVAVPIVLASPLLLSRRSTLPAGAVLAGVLPFIKWPYLVAAVAMVAVSPEPRRAARWALATAVLQAAILTAVFGSHLWQDSIIAQLHVGHRGLTVLARVWGQAFWSLIGLVVASAAALLCRARLTDSSLIRVQAAGAAGLLVTLVTNEKVGTGLNVLAPMEAALIPLAVAGVVASVRGRGNLVGIRRVAAAAAALGAVFTVSQSASLLASPRTETPFIYAGSSRDAWGRLLSSDGVERVAAQLRRCPPGVPYGGEPYFAFIAGRPMPDEQPDQFLTTHSSSLRSVAARMAAVQPLCG
jgi:hypothetical protein